MRKAKASHPEAAAPLDSDRLLEVEDRVRGAANWLIGLSILTVVAGFTLGLPLVVEGALYLLLSIILKRKQSRTAALLLCLAALVATIIAIVSIANRETAGIYFAFAMPEIALIAAVIAAVNAFRLQRMLQVPLTPSNGRRA